MKKGWKIFWIVCAVVFCLGIALCVAGAALGATWEVVEHSVPDWINLGTSREVTIEIDEEALEREFGVEKEAASETTSEMIYSNVRSIEVDAEIMELQVLVTDADENVRVELEDENLTAKLDCHQDGDELIIETNSKFKINDVPGTVWLYVPRSSMNEVDINVEAGAVYIEDINAGSLNVTVEAGEAVIDNFAAKEVDFECGAGRIEAYGHAEREIDVSCGAGEVELGIAGAKEDYNYEVECGIGEVIIGNESHSGIGSTERRSNGASKEMNIECGIGSITVDFEND